MYQAYEIETDKNSSSQSHFISLKLILFFHLSWWHTTAGHDQEGGLVGDPVGEDQRGSKHKFAGLFDVPPLADVPCWYFHFPMSVPWGRGGRRGKSCTSPDLFDLFSLAQSQVFWKGPVQRSQTSPRGCQRLRSAPWQGFWKTPLRRSQRPPRDSPKLPSIKDKYE